MDILIELFNTLSALGNHYAQFIIAQIDQQDSIFTKIGLGVLFSFLPIAIPFISANLLLSVSLRLGVLHVIISLLSYLLFLSIPTHLLNHYFFFVGYIWAFIGIIYLLVYLREIYEYLFLSLFLLTKRNEFLNFIGYHDLEHYMMHQVAKEGYKNNKSKDDRDENDDDDYDRWRRSQELRFDPLYSSLPGNIHHRR